MNYAAIRDSKRNILYPLKKKVRSNVTFRVKIIRNLFQAPALSRGLLALHKTSRNIDGCDIGKEDSHVSVFNMRKFRTKSMSLYNLSV